MNKLIINCIALLGIGLALTGCKKSDSTITEPTPPTTSSGVYILNEGSFGGNTATLDYYNLTSSQSYISIYKTVNNKALGDVANAMTVSGTKGYIVVENSNKIEIIDLGTNTSLGQVDCGNGTNPFDISVIDSIAFVSNFGIAQIQKINLNTRQVLKNYAVSKYAEGILAVNGKVFTAVPGYGEGNSIAVLDIASETFSAPIMVGSNPQYLYKGPDNMIYAVCTGQYQWVDTSGRGGIYKINPTTLKVEDSVIVYKNPKKACFVGNQVYVINDAGIQVVDFASHTVSTTPIIKGSMVNSFALYGTQGAIYSIAYDAARGYLFAGNPKDGKQAGEIVVFTPSGTEIKRFAAGILPGTIVIK
ncbi:MAG: hypothetical protein LWX56_11585 [Ignavibacteria bacterium]|nr:hypothetical protein [Ignavibacteria bacterium]